MDQPGAKPPHEVKDSSPAGESSAPPSPSSLVPTVPDYDLLRRIGRGAYGDVWLARSQATGALRAAKIVWRHTFEDAKPFQREFAGIQRFERISREHPSQLALFHIGRNEPAGYFYYVMELADAAKPRSEDGGLRMEDSDGNQPFPGHPRYTIFDPRLYAAHTLRADLERGRLPASRVLEIGLALSEALSHLHANGLVHRDVKPSNVIFVNGRPKLADIGLVTDASDQCSIVGTEGYLPPEGPGTPQADIFALGKLLYEAATGLDRRELPKLPDDLRSWPDSMQVFELNEIILEACAQDSKDRYETCDEMHADLALLVQGKSVKQKRTRQQRWVVMKRGLAGASVAGGLIVSAVVVGQQPHVTLSLSKNPEAVELYQQAVYQLHSGTTDRHMQAYTNLLEAVKLDPKFVDAYYMMLEAYFDGDNMPPYYNQLTNSRVVVAKLCELSPNSVQYHTADSFVKFMEWKFDDAIREVRLAIKINPRFVRAHGLYAYYMMCVYADAETALKEYRIAERLDPSDETIQSVLGQPYFLERKYNEAIKQYSKALQLEPRALGTYFDLFQAFDAAGQYDKALESDEQFVLAGGVGNVDTNKVIAWYQLLRKALREQGPRGVWETRLNDTHHDPTPRDTYWMAVCHARLGDTNEVMLYLNRAYEEHNGGMVNLHYDQYWDPYRGDPRFQELLKKVGLLP
jgi:serine/threonine protein kinase